MKKKSTILLAFFQYLAQIIASIRGCVSCNDLWPWPISSRSFNLDFENRVCSVTFSVLDRLFPYLPQITTTIRGCVVCEVYNNILKFQFFANFSNFSAFTLFWLGIQYELVNSMDMGFKMKWSIVWVIMRRRGVSSERRRSSCSSFKIRGKYYYIIISHEFSFVIFIRISDLIWSISSVCICSWQFHIWFSSLGNCFQDFSYEVENSRFYRNESSTLFCLSNEPAAALIS